MPEYEELQKQIDELKAKVESQERAAIQQEANLIAQEHRLVQIIYNFFIKRKEYSKDDPRYEATFRSIIWRIFSSPAVAAAGVSLVAIFSLVFAIQANYLLSAQNQKIDEQNLLQEASRRSSLIFELTSINEEITRIDNSTPDSAKFVLSPSLIGRIIALSYSLRPYRYLIDDSINANSSKRFNIWTSFIGKPNTILSTKPLSPEKAQLLTVLLNNSDIKLKDFINIDFSYLDWKGRQLAGQTIEGLNFSHASFEYSSLYDLNLMNVDLNEANFSNAFLSNFIIERSAPLESATSSNMINTNFTNAILLSCSFDAAFMYGANFSNALLKNVFFGDISDFENIEFNGAIVDGPNWINNNLKFAPNFKNWIIVEEDLNNHPCKNNPEFKYHIESEQIKDGKIWVLRRKK